MFIFVQIYSRLAFTVDEKFSAKLELF